jgi:hypothetical protein
MKVGRGRAVTGRVRRPPPGLGPGDFGLEELEGESEYYRVHSSCELFVEGDPRIGEVSPGNSRPQGHF